MQRSKIQNYCESTIEACWLAALVVTPLFFNVYSSRVFEPDKISLLRSIALVMLLAYLVKLLDGGRLWLPASGDASAGRSQLADGSGAQLAVGRKQLTGLWKQPLLLPFALLIVSYAISTIFSISPSVSWWGSYHRLQGAYTFASYLIIAVLTVAHLRQPSQLRRLQHTIVLTSLPIAIYGVMQHFGGGSLAVGRRCDNARSRQCRQRHLPGRLPHYGLLPHARKDSLKLCIPASERITRSRRSR